MKLFGSSGIRALFSGDLLTLAYQVGLAVGRSRQNVVVATDTRTSGDAMKHAVCAGLTADRVFDVYSQKHAVNLQRQDNGYSRKTKSEDDNRGIV